MRNKSKNNLGIIPPQAVELEEAVLGAIMLEKDSLTRVIDILKPEVFYKDQNKLIFEAILDLFSESNPVDLLTVTDQLRRNGNLEKAGGAFNLTELTSNIASAANIEYHSRIIQEKFLARELIRLSSDLAKSAFDDSTDVFDLMDSHLAGLIALNGGFSSSQSVTINQSAREVLNEMAGNMAKRQNHEITGVPSPIDLLNDYTGGWQKGDLILIAGRPAMGKTGFALSCARSAAKAGKGVLIFSLEMSHKDLTYRMIAQELKQNAVSDMKKGNISQSEFASLTYRVSSLTNKNITIDDTSNLNIVSLRSKATKLKASSDLGLIVVDYLQLMTGDSKSNNREQEISTISRGLKVLAKELQVPIIALSQLSRAVETRGGDKKPQLSDLRESGAIEQDADMVIFMYRPEYYGITEYEDESNGVIATNGLALGLIRKYRNGSTGDFLMRFDAKHVDFMNYRSPNSFPDSVEKF